MIKRLFKSASSSVMNKFNKNMQFSEAAEVYKAEIRNIADLEERKKMEQEFQYAKNFLSLTEQKPNERVKDHTLPVPLYYLKQARADILKKLANFLSVISSGLMLWFFWENKDLFSGTRRVDLFDTKGHIRVSPGSSIHFSDVKGIDECREELEEIVEYIKNPEKYNSVGAKLHKGILLTGLPGTGKTLLAKAIAGEAGVRFIYCSGSDFDEVFVGLGAARVRELFEQAKASAPCIIFIDEIDSVASSRIKSDSSSRQTLNQLLVEIDGFTPTNNIIVIGASNLPEAIDPALKRAGRFDKEINVPLPDIKGRTEILQLYLDRVKYDPNLNINLIAKKSTGMTGADIANIVNLAALNAAKHNREACTLEDFDFALDRVMIGITRTTLKMAEEDITNTAYHELGHAYMSYLSGFTEIHKITILPKGHSLGHTAYLPKKQHDIKTKSEVIGLLNTAVGGRAAEEIFAGVENVTTGCSSDLAKATEIIYQSLRTGVFIHDFGLPCYQTLENLGVEQRNAIDRAATKIIEDAYDHAKMQIKLHRPVIEKLAKELKAKETLTNEEFISIIKKFESYNMEIHINHYKILLEN